MTREENIALLGLRITNIGKIRYKPERGELRPELTYLLCLVSQPQKDDVVLDPFAGSGSIVLQRIIHFPYKKAYVGDIDKKRVRQLAGKFQSQNSKVKVKQWDALKLENINDNSITTIITDPPWGMFRDKDKKYTAFYHKMLRGFERVLTKNGTAIILTARKNEFKKAVTNTEFEIEREYSILVSGKKAGVYKLKHE